MAPVLPEWLLTAYVHDVKAIGAIADKDTIQEHGRTLLAEWSSSDRKYHDISHLMAVLERVDYLSQETHNPEVVRVAAFYHGAVFDPNVLKGHGRALGEDKQASAAHAYYDLLQLGVPEANAGRVRDLIGNLTRHDADPSDVDSLALCDADLGILSAEPQRYADYRKRVRAEFDHVDAGNYLDARIAIVTKLLARPKLFLSPLAGVWEDAARQNLTAELARLKRERANTGGPSADVEVTTVKSAAPSKFQRDETARMPAVTEETILPLAPPSSDDAEVVGLPFDAARAARRADSDLTMTSGIERVPAEPTDIPRKDTGAATSHTPALSAVSAASAASAEEPGVVRRSIIHKPTHVTDESTESLFRPIE